PPSRSVPPSDGSSKSNTKRGAVKAEILSQMPCNTRGYSILVPCCVGRCCVVNGLQAFRAVGGTRAPPVSPLHPGRRLGALERRRRDHRPRRPVKRKAR